VYQTVGSAYVGSNLTSATGCGTAPDLGVCRSGLSAFYAVVCGRWRASAGVHADCAPKSSEREDNQDEDTECISPAAARVVGRSGRLAEHWEVFAGTCPWNDS